jgi:hypothetical protein
MRTAFSHLLLCPGAAPAERTASESDIDATMHSICVTQTPSTHRSSCTLARGATALCPWHWDSRRSPHRVVNKSRRSNISKSAIDWMHADAHLESSLANAHASLCTIAQLSSPFILDASLWAPRLRGRCHYSTAPTLQNLVWCSSSNASLGKAKDLICMMRTSSARVVSKRLLTMSALLVFAARCANQWHGASRKLYYSLCKIFSLA